jgi:adenine-specific DNA-methyltransferase
MSWPGKADAIRAAQKQSVATLLPVDKESVDFESTGNVIIEGDNLEVLKLLQKSYLGKIKMIYIDPPYNTGNDFIYPDNYSESLQTYLEYTGQVDDEGKRFSTNTETDGRFHSKWMSMMYPRLVLARNLLSEDGVIFISIDDNEVSRLQAILEEVFGSEGSVATFVWKSKSGGANDSGLVATDHEYVVAFARSTDLVQMQLDTEAEATTNYNQVDEKGRYSLERLDKQNLQYSKSLDYEIVGPDGLTYRLRHRDPKNPNAIWRWSKSRVEENMDELVFKDGNVYTKNYEKAGQLPRSLLVDERFGRTRTGGTEVRELFGHHTFDNPKPTKLIRFFTEVGTSKDSIVLDFFAGSGTTGHAVLAQNAKDGGSRRFILVQLPEPVEEGSEAAKAGFETIADITKERVRRAAKEIAKEAGGASKLKLADGSGQQDLGFRVFRLDKSNFQVWDAAAPAGDEGKLQEQLAMQVEHVVKGRKGLDVVFEVLLKSKLPLTSKVEKLKLGAGEVWSVNGGVLLVVVDEGVDVAGVRELAKRNPKPETVVFLDRCFGGKDSLKANARKIFQDANIEFKTI